MSTVPAAWLCTPSFDRAGPDGLPNEQALRRRYPGGGEGAGHTSEYAFAVTEQTINTSILHVSMLRPASGLSEEEKQLAVRYLARQRTAAYR